LFHYIGYTVLDISVPDTFSTEPHRRITVRELLFSVTKKDLKIEYFSGTGAGGQHRNKHQNCVRMYHPESGVRVTGQSHKERASNMAEAFKNLTRSSYFKTWQVWKINEMQTGKTLKQLVEESMDDKNLKVEYKEGGGTWVVDGGTLSTGA
jgi:protein subunit release factor B